MAGGAAYHRERGLLISIKKKGWMVKNFESVYRSSGGRGGSLPRYRLMGMGRCIGSAGLTIMGLHFP